MPGFNFRDFMTMMNTKARQSDVEELVKNKTNKTDSENQMKAIDILHRQIQHLIILQIEVVKELISDQPETF
jgi:hypothetical protein